MWTGQCSGCGKCCLIDYQWVGFQDEDSKKRALQWAEARGYKVIQVGNDSIQCQFKNKCPQLSGGKCKLHGTRKKPDWCTVYPFNMKNFNGFDPNKLVPEGCSFKWVEVDGE